MTDDRFADHAAGSAHDVEDTSRKPDLVRGFSEHERAQRREFRGLEYDRAPSRKCRRNLRDHLVKRVVPRRHASDDANGFLHDERVSDLFFLRMLAEELRVEADHRRRKLCLHLRRKPECGADLVRDGFGGLRHARFHRR